MVVLVYDYKMYIDIICWIYIRRYIRYLIQYILSIKNKEYTFCETKVTLWNFHFNYFNNSSAKLFCITLIKNIIAKALLQIFKKSRFWLIDILICRNRWLGQKENLSILYSLWYILHFISGILFHSMISSVNFTDSGSCS